MRNAVFAAAVLGALALAGGAHAKTVADHSGKCQAQVPDDWTPGEFGLGMQSPDGKDTVAINAAVRDSVAEDKMVAQSTFSIDQVITDTPAQYFITLADRVGKPTKHLYIAVAAGAGSCVLSVDYEELSDGDARAIALSLRGR